MEGAARPLHKLPTGPPSISRHLPLVSKPPAYITQAANKILQVASLFETSRQSTRVDQAFRCQVARLCEIHPFKVFLHGFDLFLEHC